jgi:uncharacterized DUF497 family protein
MQSLEFDWDDDNIGHLALRGIKPENAEQVILNRPLDLSTELRSGEERVAQVGETDEGRILIVISTMRGGKIRVVTAWPANERLRRYFKTQKRSGHVGRIEEQDIRE